MFIRTLFKESSSRLKSPACSTTALPFLYQTPTILRAFATSSIDPIQHETATAQTGTGRDFERGEELKPNTKSGPGSKRRPRKNQRHKPFETNGEFNTKVHTAKSDVKGIGYVPFEGSTGFIDPIGDLKGTTITPWEKKAFQALKERKMRQISAITDTRKHADEDVSEEEDEIGRLLEDAFMRDNKGRRSSKELASRKDVELAETIATNGKTADKRYDMDETFKSAFSHYSRIRKKIDDAPTDIALWQCLQTDVFDPIKRLELNVTVADSIPPSNRTTKKSTKSNSQSVEKEKRIWAICLPNLLQVGMIELSKFPGSTLSLSVLGSLKKLGQGAFEFGATTQLYNQHLQLLRSKHSDIFSFNNTLAEMHQKVYRFDDGTQHAIAAMLAYATDAMAGRYGPGVRAIWRTDRKQRAVDELSRWRTVVEETLVDNALRKANRANSMNEHEIKAP